MATGPDVVVVGAGILGLASAHHILQAGRGLGRKPETFGLGLLPPGSKRSPRKFFDFSGEILIQTPFAKAFQYANHMEKLAKKRLVAR